ncbi:hypothetical protein B4U79_16056 [Dinothrombium tinctorium]|uniref:Uncharacterized protein n=1 Tax=Dinothrombium tinctorium TaxID=1965070 RepID=A0A443RKH1_9ACAR|nr:hypothetical protein B4U79_16056 [Dinothrombium tinctorium]
MPITCRATTRAPYTWGSRDMVERLLKKFVLKGSSRKNFATRADNSSLATDQECGQRDVDVVYRYLFRTRINQNQHQTLAIMETCVLIPPEYSLVLRPHNGHKALDASKNGILSANGGTEAKKKSDENGNRFHEMNVCVWSNQYIRKGTYFLPFQGTIRLDRLEVYSLLDDNDVSIERVKPIDHIIATLLGSEQCRVGTRRSRD